MLRKLLWTGGDHRLHKPRIAGILRRPQATQTKVCVRILMLSPKKASEDFDGPFDIIVGDATDAIESPLLDGLQPKTLHGKPTCQTERVSADVSG